MPTENRSSDSDGVSELLPCPFCKAAMRIESNRDWHRVMGDHDDECVFMDPETMMVPATDEQRELLVRDWNRRAQPAEQHQGESMAVVDEGDDGLFVDFIYGENGNPLRRGDKLYAHPAPAGAGEVERLRQEVADLIEARDLRVTERLVVLDGLRAQLAERDALLREQSGTLVVLAARLLQEPLRVLNGDLDSDGPITRIKVTDGVERAGDSLGSLALEVRRAADALSAAVGLNAPTPKYPNRLCHIDYTAHPYLCGCLRGNEESQRIYDEHCRAVSAETEAKR